MVPILARQAVIIKSVHNTSIMLGNYECAYALGLLIKISGMQQPQEYENLEELRLHVLAGLKEYVPQNEREENLIHMLQFYKADKTMDGQVAELLNMGLSETNPWTV